MVITIVAFSLINNGLKIIVKKSSLIESLNMELI